MPTPEQNAKNLVWPGGIISPAQITANQNDYAPGVAGLIRLNADAAYDITGMLAAVVNGVAVQLVNVSGFNLTLKHQDVLSVATNRFLIGGGADRVLQPNEQAVGFYDKITGRWRIEGEGVASGGTASIFFLVETSTASGDYRQRSVGTNGSFNFNFNIPSDFNSLISFVAVGIVSAGAAGIDKGIDLTSQYGLAGQASNFNAESDIGTLYDLSGTSGQLTEIVDLSVVLSAIAAGQYGGINVAHDAIGGAIGYLGLRLNYNK